MKNETTAAKQPKRVLVVEDDLDFARMIRLMLEDDFRECDKCVLQGAAVCNGIATGADGVLSPVAECIRSSWVVTIADRVAAAADLLHKNSFDVILLDMVLPDAQTEDAVALIHDAAPHTPIVVQSALCDRDLIQSLMLKEKIINYMIKGEHRSSWALKQQLCLNMDTFHVLHDSKQQLAGLASQ